MSEHHHIPYDLAHISPGRRVSSLGLGSLTFDVTKTSIFHLRRRRRDAFSLIEVVLAIGVVAFALVGIFSLFSASLKTNKEASVQQEGFEIAREVSSRLQDTNFLPTNALPSLMQALYQSPRTSTNLYLYSSTNGTIILTNNSSGYTVGNGALYLIQLWGSYKTKPTFTFLPPVNVFPTAQNNNPRASDWVNWPGLPLTVIAYSLPSPGATNTATNNPPVMTFDMVVPR